MRLKSSDGGGWVYNGEHCFGGGKRFLELALVNGS